MSSYFGSDAGDPGPDRAPAAPADHAATVREALPSCGWACGDCKRCRAYVVAFKQLVALAERATELERDAPFHLQEAATFYRRKMEEAEARATELQRDVHAAWEVARAQCERAERAETALRWIGDGGHYSDCRGNACDCASRRARVALVETAP